MIFVMLVFSFPFVVSESALDIDQVTSIGCDVLLPIFSPNVKLSFLNNWQIKYKDSTVTTRKKPLLVLLVILFFASS
jgi:hypothetical protein